jgi:hypothetical protein
MSAEDVEDSGISDILRQVQSLAEKTESPRKNGFDHIGYLIWLNHNRDGNTCLVSCDECSHTKPEGSVHLFRANVLPLGQDCHFCGKVMEEGESQ